MFATPRHRLAANANSRKTRRIRRTFTLEPLEERVVLSPTIFTVNTNVDGTESGTLRWAITQANNNSNSAGSMIEFSAGLSGETIDLSSTLGTLDLTETAGPEEIDGPSGGVTVSGGNAVEVFDVASHVTATISGVTITEGNSSYYGGGLLNDGTVTLDDCTITGSTGLGGGIENLGTLTLTDSSVTQNSCIISSGAGIDNRGVATITDSSISDNSPGGILNYDSLTITGSSLANNSGQTGAIDNGPAGTVTITNSSLTNNSVPNEAGGAISNLGVVTLTNCTVSDNYAEFAGGIETVTGTVTLTNCTISGNSAAVEGGGIANDGGTLTLTSCTVADNSAGSYGGVFSTGTARLTDTIVAGNTGGDIDSDADLGSTSSSHNLIGTGGSGGLSNGVDGNIVLTGSETAGLASLGNYGGPTQSMALLPGSPAIGTGKAVSGITTDQRGEIRGSVVDIGAVEVSLVVESTAGTNVTAPPSSLTLPGTVSLANQFADSEITFGPNVFGTPQTITLASGTLDLTNTGGTTTITGPTAGVSVSGGGANGVFQVNSGVAASLSGLTITGGDADFGGGMYNDGGTVVLSDCTFVANEGGYGAIGNTGTLTITDSSLTNNTAEGIDGACVSNTGTLTITDSSLTSNNSSSAGAIYNAGTVTITDSFLANNAASSSGGIFNAAAGTATITDSSLANNSSLGASQSGGGGGGIYNEGAVTLTSCILSDNSAVDLAGGILNRLGTVTLTSCTLSDNAGTDGGGILIYDGAATLTNCTVSGNSATSYGGGILNLFGTATLTSCTVADNSAASAGGLYNYSDTVALTDTIVAGNTGSNGANDIGGASASTVTGSYNLIGTGGSGGITNSTDGNIVLTGPETAGLAALFNYGGPTQTMALLPGSPALGTGTAISGITTDQRGETLASPVPDIGAFQSQGFVVTITGGNNQTGVVGSSFADPLSVTVTATDPQEPVAGGVVSFTAPASGASASFTGNPAVIGANGSASVSATTNSVGGSYPVTASTGVGSASFSLTNVSQPAFSNLAAPTITYGTAAATLGGTILAGSFVPSGDVNITVDNVTEQATVNASGDFSVAFPTAGLGVAGAPYTITYAYAGNGTFQPVTDNSPVLTVTQATPTLAVTGVMSTYDGEPQPASFTITGVNGDNLTSLVTLTYNASASVPVNAGSYAVVASFPGDTNYAAVSNASQSVVIAQATPTLNVTGVTSTYDGEPQPASFTITGVNGDNLTSLVTLTYNGSASVPVNAGTYAVVASFPGDTNYVPVSNASQSVVIAQATPTLNVIGVTSTYDGEPQPANFTITGVNGDNLTSLVTLTYYGSANVPVNAGTYAVVASFPGDTNYVPVSNASQSVAIAQATPTLVVNGVTSTYDGEPQPASFTITGVNGDNLTSLVTLTYNGSASVPVNAGSYAVVASFPGDTNYAAVSNSSQSVVIAQATPTLSVTGVTSTYDGEPQPASFTITGVNGDNLTSLVTLSYNGSPDVPVNAGTYAVVVSFPGDTNYVPVSNASQSVVIAQATPTLEVTGVTTTYDGEPQPASFTITGVNGDNLTSLVTLTYNGPASVPVNAGTYAVVASFPGDTNYVPVSNSSQSVVIAQATPTLNVTGVTSTYDGEPQPASFTITGVNGDNLTSLVTLTYNGSASVPVNAGTYAVLASFPGDTNYVPVSNALRSVVINASATRTNLTSSSNPVIPGQLVTFTAIVSPVAPGGGTPTGNVTFKYGSTVIATVPVSAVGGQVEASVTTTLSTAGTSAITSSYANSDGNYTDSSASLNETVQGAGVYVSGTTLYVVGANTSDYASISPAGSKTDGSTGLAVSATLNGTWSSQTFIQTFTAIVITGYGGNDDFQLACSLALPMTVTEGNGNNYILLAGGNDTVTLGTGSNQVFGGNGNKMITDSDAAGTSAYIQLGNGNDVINMGAGNDQVVLGSGNNTVTAGNGNDAVTTSGSGNNAVTLGNGNDYVATGNGNDVIALGSGNETVLTGNGNKTITGGNGTDYVSAGNGTVVVTLGNGADNVQVGSGSDSITLGSGNDYVSGGSGNDVVTAASGADNVQLGGGNDTVTLGDGNDYVSASGGNDNVTVGNGNDNIQLGNGSDVIIEGNGNDYVSAGNGADLVVAGLGQHTVQLGNGNDILIDGSATVVNSGDSFRQILSDWNSSSSASVDTRLKVVYNTAHPSVMQAGSGRDWWFYTYSKDVTNKKSTDRLN